VTEVRVSPSFVDITAWIDRATCVCRDSGVPNDLLAAGAGEEGHPDWPSVQSSLNQERFRDGDNWGRVHANAHEGQHAETQASGVRPPKLLHRMSI
jgi:hypothetical protein